jgi:hypothetical protein
VFPQAEVGKYLATKKHWWGIDADEGIPGAYVRTHPGTIRFLFGFVFMGLPTLLALWQF